MTFKKGEINNPKGGQISQQKKRNVFKAIVSPQEKALMEKAVTMALDGNERMLMFILERICPAKMAEDRDGKRTPMLNMNLMLQIVNEHEKEF